MATILKERDLSICEIIEQVQAYAAQNLKAAVQFFDSDNLPVTSPSRVWDFHRVLLKTEAGTQQLSGSLHALVDEALRRRHIHTTTCPFTGLLHACIPTHCYEKYIGFWVVGQTLLPEDECSNERYENTLQCISQTIGLHRYPLRKLLRELPVMPQAEFMEAVLNLDETTQVGLSKVAKAQDSKVIFFDRSTRVTSESVMYMNMLS